MKTVYTVLAIIGGIAVLIWLFGGKFGFVLPSGNTASVPADLNYTGSQPRGNISGA